MPSACAMDNFYRRKIVFAPQNHFWNGFHYDPCTGTEVVENLLNLLVNRTIFIINVNFQRSFIARNCARSGGCCHSRGHKKNNPFTCTESIGCITVPRNIIRQLWDCQFPFRKVPFNNFFFLQRNALKQLYKVDQWSNSLEPARKMWPAISR